MTSIFDWHETIAARDTALAQVAANAGDGFAVRAAEYIVSYLLRHHAAPQQQIIDDGEAAGIVGNWRNVFRVLRRCGQVRSAEIFGGSHEH